jgi:signal transduction histidine kinase
MKKIISKILLKITILVIVEIILIVVSFSVLAYFQSQQSSIGNSINIAGKNRYLTANLLFQTEKYIDGSSDASQLKSAMDSLQSNIMTLKQGGRISGIDLRPLSSGFLDMWNVIDQNWNNYKISIAKEILIPDSAKETGSSSLTAIDRSLTEKGLESKAYSLVNSSDKLVTQLGEQADKNSENVMLLQILFAIVIVGILVLILYLVARMLKPIFILTHATSEIKKGNLDVSVEQKGSDELSVLSESFNSMVGAIRGSTIKQDELTKKLEVANEELKYKDRLKDEFINIAAHELKTPIQPILGLTEILHSQIKDVKQKELLDTIFRNAKRLNRLTEDVLDLTKIESQSLQLHTEQFNLREMILNTIADSRNEIKKEYKDNIVLEFVCKKNIFIEADRGRLNQVVSNLLNNAIKFTNKEGIIITTAEKKDTHVVISVKDTGTGIDPEILPRLFTRFVTKSESKTGTGLGLFISKSIVEAHGGRIWAENNADAKGATFTFRLPLEC